MFDETKVYIEAEPAVIKEIVDLVKGRIGDDVHVVDLRPILKDEDEDENKNRFIHKLLKSRE